MTPLIPLFCKGSRNERGKRRGVCALEDAQWSLGASDLLSLFDFLWRGEDIGKFRIPCLHTVGIGSYLSCYGS